MMRTRVVYCLLISIFSAFILMSCGKDDGNEPAPVIEEEENEKETAPVITASDFTGSILENPASGQSIGTIAATTDKESLTFSLSSQSHAGALVLNETTGELTVGDETHFVHQTNPQLTATAVLTAGSTEQTVAITVNVKRTPDIFFIGRASDQNNFPAYWKNEERTILVDNSNAVVEDVAVAANGDVYVAGYHYEYGDDMAILWKNGEEIILGPDGAYSYATAVTVSGTDVYVAGSTYDEGTEIAIWKNGELLDLTYPGGEYFMEIEALAVVKNNNGEDELWGVGQKQDGEAAVASYIIIDNITTGPPYDADVHVYPLEANYATDIAISGSDVYITMYQRSEATGEYVAKYWKDGEYISLSDGQTETYAFGVAVTGSDVYVAGYEQDGSKKIPMYWKNKTATSLPTPSSSNAEVYSLRVFEGDVYILGRISGSSPANSAVIWRNGQIFRTIPNAVGYRMALH